MDKTIVGNNAGKVWYALKEIGEISIPELAEKIKPKRRKYSIGRRLVGTREQNLYPTEKWINCFI